MRAVKEMEVIDPAIPALYHSNLRLVDAELGFICTAHMKPVDYVSRYMALAEPVATGCTMVINLAAKELLCGRLPDRYKMHDEWTYLVISLTGKVVYDFVPHVSYRQHGGNVLSIRPGTNALKTIIMKLRRKHGSRWIPRSVHAGELREKYTDILSKNDVIIAGKMAGIQRIGLSQAQAAFRAADTRIDRIERLGIQDQGDAGNCLRLRQDNMDEKGGLFRELTKYRFLIKQLVNRDFKTKYKRSVLGVFWSFLNPLLTMVVQYIVFSNLFRFDIENYPVYLLTGILMFNYFNEACSLTLMSIVSNASLITKVYVPKYIYPLTRVMSSFINLLISMIPLALVVAISGLRPTACIFLAIIPVLCIAVFCLGLGMLLATSMVFFQDTQFLWGVVSMIWMYLTPIFYPASILPDSFRWIIDVNPLYYFIDFMRTCIITGMSPEPRVYLMCILWAAAMLLLGTQVFRRNQDKFILYL